MRYYSTNNTLFIRGLFRAASTGTSGGVRSVPAILIHSAPPDATVTDPEKTLDLIMAGAGLGTEYYGLITAVPAEHACVLQYDYITVFISAAIRREPPGNGGSINIIIMSGEGMADSALIEAVMIASEAKAEALMAMDMPLTGTPADGVIAACEGEGTIYHHTAGRGSEAGRRIREAVLHGIPEAIGRHDAGVREAAPAFFIFSRLQEDHWIKWSKKDCPYYPCHFEGQSCDFCYCPFYPCHDETLGQWTTGSNGKKVWNCASCTLLHEPDVAAYFKRYPKASLQELKKLASAPKRKSS